MGLSHLRKNLTHEQLTELLKHGRIEPDQYHKIKSDDLEKQGSITLMVNGIFTGVVGGWLASIGFIA